MAGVGCKEYLFTEPFFEYTGPVRTISKLCERLAQLVERYIDIVEVTGSSPVSLTEF